VRLLPVIGEPDTDELAEANRYGCCNMGNELSNVSDGDLGGAYDDIRTPIEADSSEVTLRNSLTSSV